MRRQPRLPISAALLAALLCGPVLQASQAQGNRQGAPADKLQDVEKQLQQEQAQKEQAQKDADAIRGEVERLRQQSIDVAKQTRDAEETVARLERRRKEIEQLIAERAHSLEQRRAQLAGLLAALERLANRPPEALLAEPGAPDDMVRTGILLRATVPQINDAAAKLKTEIDDLAALRDEAAANATQVSAASTALQREQQRLDESLTEKSQLERAKLADVQARARQTQKLATEAHDLRDLIDRIEADRRRQEEAAARRAHEMASRKPDKPFVEQFKPPGYMTVPFSATRGKLPLPVAGTVVRRFGEPDDSGQAARGILIRTGPKAPVTAPHDGLIVYAGPFRGYGQLLIIEQGEGYHFLLAGLSRIDGVAGQWVLAGEPVGTMGSAGKDSQQLYVELRRQGVPIDPLSWLIVHKDKVG